MTDGPSSRPRLLLVGGGGGLVGRAVLPRLLPHFRVRSVHRHPTPGEGPEVEWITADVKAIRDWAPLLEGVDVVLNLAWYRWESEDSFRALHDGLQRLIEAAARLRIARFLHVSVPPAPPSMEQGLPYLFYKRRIDHALATSGLSYRIVRPTMLFGPGDVLIGVMMRLMRRYPVFPMFGKGDYHVSPVAVSDLAQLLVTEARGQVDGTLDVGGPERMTYHELTDRMFRALEKTPRYWRWSGATARRVTGLMVALGSTTLYPYEVEWLMSDLLGTPSYERLGTPMQTMDEYLAQVARELTART